MKELLAEIKGGLSQTAFAHQIGVAQSTVAGWLAGESLPNAQAFVALVEKYPRYRARLFAAMAEGKEKVTA
jgi:DNA-binding transcriptional regulator YiaG